MKRILLLLCLFTISFSIVATSESETREFITGFFQAIKGNDWKLNPECLGATSQEQLNQLVSALMAADWQKAFSIFTSMAIEAKSECPYNDVLELKNRLTQEIKEGKLFEDVKSNANQIIRVLGEAFHSQQRTPFVLGRACGSIASLILYEKQHNSFAFLALPDSQVFLDFDELKLSKDDFDKFFRGFLTGVSAVPYEQNKCYQEVAGSLDEIEADAKKLYDAIVNRSTAEFAAALAQLTASLLKIKAYDQNCKVVQLVKSLSVYSASYAGLAKLIYNIATNGGKYFELSKEMVQAVKEKNFEKGGVTSGKIVKILLSWETS